MQDYLTLEELERYKRLEVKNKDVLYHGDNYVIVREKLSESSNSVIRFYKADKETNDIFQKITSYSLEKGESVKSWPWLFLDGRGNIFIPIYPRYEVQFALKFNFQNETVEKVKFKNHFDAYHDILPDTIKEKVKILEYNYDDYWHFHCGNYIIFVKPYHRVSSDRCDRCGYMNVKGYCDNHCKYQDIREMQFVYVYDKQANEFFEIDLTGKVLSKVFSIEQVSDNLITLYYDKAQDENASSTQLIFGRQFFNLDTRKTILDVTSDIGGLYHLGPIYYLEPIPPDMVSKIEELTNPKLFDLITKSRFLVIHKILNKICIYDQDGIALINFDFDKQSYPTLYEKVFKHKKDIYKIPAKIWVDFLIQEEKKQTLRQIFSSFFKPKNTENKNIQHERVLKI